MKNVDIRYLNMNLSTLRFESHINEPTMFRSYLIQVENYSLFCTLYLHIMTISLIFQ